MKTKTILNVRAFYENELECTPIYVTSDIGENEIGYLHATFTARVSGSPGLRLDYFGNLKKDPRPAAVAHLVDAARQIASELKDWAEELEHVTSK